MGRSRKPWLQTNGVIVKSAGPSPIIVDGQCKFALRPPFHERAMSWASPDLTERGVHVEEPVIRDEFGRTEADACGAGARVGNLVDRMSRSPRLRRRHAVQCLQIMVGGERYRGAGEHDKRLRAAR